MCKYTFAVCVKDAGNANLITFFSLKYKQECIQLLKHTEIKHNLNVYLLN